MKLIELEIKTIMDNNNSPLNSYTLYMFSKKDKIIFSIALTEESAHAILRAQSKNESPRPHIHNTAKRLIKGLGGTLVGTIIYKELNGIFYTYLRIKHNNREIDIDAKATDALCIALQMHKPIYIQKDLLDDLGIKVTKELLETAKGIA